MPPFACLWEGGLYRGYFQLIESYWKLQVLVIRRLLLLSELDPYMLQSSEAPFSFFWTRNVLLSYQFAVLILLSQMIRGMV